MTSWSKQFLEWTEGNQAFLSVVFTWHLPAAYQRAVWLGMQGYTVRAGGPAVALMPDYMADVAECGGDMPALEHHNPQATFTSRGCIRHCAFCAVWRTEGKLRELDDWPVRPIVCDNNLLACSRVHFDRVIDRLKPLRGIDFNQGLDARLLTKYHAGRLAELDCMVRLAFDSIAYEAQFMRAFETLRTAHIPKRRISVYVLFGFKDTPEDALYRLETVHNLGCYPYSMRYNPLDTLHRNSYVAPGWTDTQLTDYGRYWSGQRYFGGIPFAEYVARQRLPLTQAPSYGKIEMPFTHQPTGQGTEP